MATAAGQTSGTSQTTTRQFAEGEKFLQRLQSKIAVATAEMNGCRELATEAAVELNVAQADLSLQLAPWEPA